MGSRCIGQNVLWLSFDHILALIDGLFVGALVARHLGPDRLGIFSYGLSLLALSLPLARLGTDRILVRSLAEQNAETATVFWNGFFARLAMTVVLLAIVVTTSWLTAKSQFQPNDEAYVLVVCMAALLIVPLDVFRLPFEAATNSRPVVLTSAVCRCVSAGFRLWLVASGEGVVHFAITHAATLLAAGAITSILSVRFRRVPAFRRFDYSTIRLLLRQSWPLAASAVAASVYINIDVTMLRSMASHQAAGLYSVAVQFGTLSYFLPLAVTNSLFPALSRISRRDPDEFDRQQRKLIVVLLNAAFVVVLLSMFVLPLAIQMLFGSRFAESIPLLRLHCLSLPFVFVGVAVGPSIVVHGWQRHSLWASLAGAVTNVVLNLFLIPRFGTHGAAASTVVSYAIAGVGWFVFARQTRSLGLLSVWLLCTAPVEAAVQLRKSLGKGQIPSIGQEE